MNIETTLVKEELLKADRLGGKKLWQTICNVLKFDPAETKEICAVSEPQYSESVTDLHLPDEPLYEEQAEMDTVSGEDQGPEVAQEPDKAEDVPGVPKRPTTADETEN